MEPLKNLFSSQFYDFFCDEFLKFSPDFDRNQFINLIFDADWKNRELKDRMRHTALVLHHFLPTHFPDTARLLARFCVHMKDAGFGNQALQYMFVPDYIQLFGIEYFEESADAFAQITPFTSCEFAVRPFIVKYPQAMIERMLAWSGHENHHVRRLSSEGSRPRLPWAMALPDFKKDPSAILPILENLKKDSSEYVRRSVANSLNDIAKDNPQIVLAILQHWKGLGKETDYILKHGSRTLLKQGHKEALGAFGLHSDDDFVLDDFKIHTLDVKIGETLTFSFSIENRSEVAAKIRLEYGLYFRKQNGLLSKKVFKISEKEFAPNEKATLVRNQSFRLITTRVFYTGEHALSIIVNGEEKLKGMFRLTI